jgi:hypothetical protein
VTTKHRFRNKYRLQIREKDHLPMHVHLVGGEVNSKIDLLTLTISEGDCPAGLAEEVLAWVTEHRDELILEWKIWHP